MKKVEEQKGPIDCTMPTMKTITPEKRERDDLQMRKERFDGQTLKLHTPKQ
jgi:hypothetical protein